MRSCLLTIMKVCTRSQLERITGSGRIQKKKHAGPKCALVRARKSHPAGPQQHTTHLPFFSLILRNNSLHSFFISSLLLRLPKTPQAGLKLSFRPSPPLRRSREPHGSLCRGPEALSEVGTEMVCPQLMPPRHQNHPMVSMTLYSSSATVRGLP